MRRDEYVKLNLMGIFIAGGYFVLGIILGSFISCVVDRLAKKEDIIFKRSYCPVCHHQLAWFDLIPIVSFLILRGRCRYCQAKISWEYPLVELSTGLLFTAIPLTLGVNSISVFLIIITVPLVIIFLYDLKHSFIPDGLIYPSLAFTLLFWLGEDWFLKNHFTVATSFFLKSLIGLGIFGGFLGFLYLLTRGRGMGLGDVELGLLLGAILGWPQVLVGLFLSFLIGAILGLFLITTTKKGWKTEVPFGPFLVLGSLTAFLFGSFLINWFLAIL